MTTLNSVKARARTAPLKKALLATLLAWGVGGCESGANILNGGNTPQAQVVQPAQPAANAAQSARVAVGPIIGPPEAVTQSLQTSLASAIDRRKISATAAPGAQGEYEMRGYIVAARETSGTKISYIWDVMDRSGRRVQRLTGEEIGALTAKDPWSAVTPQIIQNISEKTATQLASALPGTSGSVPVASAAPVAAAAPAAAAAAAPAATPAVASAQTPAATPAALTTGAVDSNAPLNTIVPSVTGAPGDGSTSLTNAIQRELSKNGVALANVPGAKTYKVEGRVVMGQNKDGKQPIQIEWNVLDPKGKKLGTVSQKNEVPQGSLDGAWGKTADAAAQAAAQGIIKLLPAQKATN